MKDGAEAKIVNQVVQCGGFKQLVTTETCQQGCEYFDAVHEEPVYGRTEESESAVVGYNYYIKCIRPRVLPFQAIGEFLPKIDNLED